MMDLHQGTLMLLGPTMNAKVAFELSERIPHLGLRMKEHCHRALVFATRMKKLGLKVIYPGLEDHPNHNLLKSFGNKDYGFGGLLCVDMETEERANRLMNHLQNTTQFGLMAVSLGYYETLMSCSGSSTSSELNAEEKALAGISPGLVRMSIGYIGTLEQRWSQFEKALSRMQDSATFNKYWTFSRNQCWNKLWYCLCWLFHVRMGPCSLLFQEWILNNSFSSGQCIMLLVCHGTDFKFNQLPIVNEFPQTSFNGLESDLLEPFSWSPQKYVYVKAYIHRHTQTGLKLWAYN